MIYHIVIEMPGVAWSSVSGARSRGYFLKEEEDALRYSKSIVRQLEVFELNGAFVIIYERGEEYLRHKILCIK